MAEKNSRRNQTTDALFDAILSLETREECYNFFEDLCTVKEISDMAQRLEAAKAVLEREGRQVRICRWTCGSTSFEDILRIERPSAVIAFEAAALSDMAELSKGEPAFPLLYGCGSTAGIAAALEKSRVTAITAINVFSAGYLAVEAGAKLARHENWTGVSTVGFSIVRKETMYDSDNQKLLFPVT